MCKHKKSRHNKIKSANYKEKERRLYGKGTPQPKRDIARQLLKLEHEYEDERATKIGQMVFGLIPFGIALVLQWKTDGFYSFCICILKCEVIYGAISAVVPDLWENKNAPVKWKVYTLFSVVVGAIIYLYITISSPSGWVIALPVGIYTIWVYVLSWLKLKATYQRKRELLKMGI